MKKHIIVLSSFFLMTLQSCTEKAPLLEKGEAIIAGRVINFQGSTKTIRFAVSDVVPEIERTVIIDSLGNFRLIVELYHPHNIQMFFKNGAAMLFLYPSDSIHFEIDEDVFSSERFPSYFISGIGRSVKFSKNIRDYLRFTGESKFSPDTKDKSVNEFLTILKKEVSNQDSILQMFCKNNKVTSEFKKWATRDIRYIVANYLVHYHSSHLQGYDGTLFDKALFPVNDDAAIATSMYSVHLWHYALNLGIWQDSISRQLYSDGNYIDAYPRILNTIVNSEQQGLSRDIMCYKLIGGLLKESPEDFVTIVDKVEWCIDNQLLIDALNDKKTKCEAEKNVNIAYLDYGTTEEREITGDFWKELKEKYAGKLIYLDIWATWCGPCRYEIPHSIDLHDYFEGENIAFVNLCLNSEKPGWEQMIIDNNIRGDNYFFNQSQSQLLRDKLQFNGYPTYMIIDQQGNIIEKSAPRPSSKDKIRNILQEMI